MWTITYFTTIFTSFKSPKMIKYQSSAPIPKDAPFDYILSDKHVALQRPHFSSTKEHKIMYMKAVHLPKNIV